MTETIPPVSIYKALVAAQSGMSNALKDKNNPAFKSKYADLASVREAVMPSLNASGLCVIQQPETDADGAVFVRTILAHESGATITHEGPHVKLGQKQDAQAVGSVITYLRRYNLMAVCGIAPDDDDGNGAVGNGAGGGPVMQPVGRNAAPVVSKQRGEAPAAVAAKPRKMRFDDLGEDFWDDPVLPLGDAFDRDGRAHPDWTNWCAMYRDAARAAILRAEPTTALAELYESNKLTEAEYIKSGAKDEAARNWIVQSKAKWMAAAMQTPIDGQEDAA